MLKQILVTAGATIALVNAIHEPLEFAVSVLEKAANELEKLASFLEENVPRKEK
jgi:hypothetical protein